MRLQTGFMLRQGITPALIRVGDIGSMLAVSLA